MGFSRPRAGVPVLERDRLVDFPKEPVSAMLRRVLVVPSCLGGKMAMSACWWCCKQEVRRCNDDLRIDHGVGSLDAVLADVAFVIGDVVQDERRHGGR